MARTRAAERDRDATRERILAAAYQVFAERGFRAATLDGVAKAALLTRAGVLHHFAGKDDLLLALLDARDAELGVVHRDDVTATGLLLDVQVAVRAILARRDLVALAHALSAEGADPGHPAHGWLVGRYARIRDDLEAAFTRSFDRGELVRREDPAVLAALVLAATEGLEAQWLVDPEAVDVEQGIELLSSLVLTRLAV